MNSVTDLKHIFIALIISCVLHAVLIYMQFIDRKEGAVNSTVQAWKKLRPSDALNVSLIPIESVVAYKKSTPTNEKSLSENRVKEKNQIHLPELKYYSTNKLTNLPKPIAEVELDTPEAMSMNVSGKLILRLWINERGEVIKVDLESSEVPELITESAVAAFKQLLFVPGDINGQQVGSVMVIEITYENGQVTLP